MNIPSGAWWMTITFLGSSFLIPLKSGLILNSECLWSVFELSNIVAHLSKLLSTLKVKTEVTYQDMKEELLTYYFKKTINHVSTFNECKSYRQTN